MEKDLLIKKLIKELNTIKAIVEATDFNISEGKLFSNSKFYRFEVELHYNNETFVYKTEVDSITFWEGSKSDFKYYAICDVLSIFEEIEFYSSSHYHKHWIKNLILAVSKKIGYEIKEEKDLEVILKIIEQLVKEGKIKFKYKQYKLILGS